MVPTPLLPASRTDLDRAHPHHQRGQTCPRDLGGSSAIRLAKTFRTVALRMGANTARA